ncbi:MAG: M20/M25/M40 family metallo-hydrolase [Runella sp.]
MHRSLLSSFAISTILVVFLASRGSDSYVGVFRQLNENMLAQSQAYENLREATSTIGHRLTGSPNGTKAEQFAFNLFKKYGYNDVKFQPFEMDAWLRDTVTLEVVPNKSDNFRTVPVVALAHSPVYARVNGPIVDVGNGLEEDFEAVKSKVKGAIAMVNIGLINPKAGQKNLHRSEKTALAIKYGAKAIITVNQVPGEVLLTGTASVTGELIAIPAVNISKESGDEIRSWSKVDTDLHAIINMTNVSRKAKARNVIATLKGKTDERIVIGGHLDSWDLATGATDNGLGSFTILDIARAFKALKIKPRRTIDFVLFMGEEQGLLGSRQMVKELIRTNQIEKVRFMMNLDMTNNVQGMNIGGREELIPFFQDIGEQIKKIDPNFANTLTSRAGLHSDHQPFMLEGIPTGAPASKFGPKVFGCYHANCDNFDLVSREEMVNGARFTAMMLYALAQANEIPARKLDSEKTRELLTAQGLKNELILGRDWKWGN